MKIKNQLQKCELDGFVASDGWLDKWKATYAIKVRQVVGEGGDVLKKQSRLGLKDSKN